VAGHEGRAVFVTGAGSGIGAAVAERFVRDGARVALVDRRLDAAQALAARWPGQALALQADVSREDEVERALDATVAQFGALHAAVNAAGLAAGAHIVDLKLAQWQTVLDVDLTGVFLCTKHEARQMLRQGGGGVIVNIASTNAVQPAEGLGAYCAAKAGVVMFNQVAAAELAPHGIRVVGVGPGLTETALTAPLLRSDAVRGAYLRGIPAGRAAAPGEIAALVAWLASDEAAYVNGETVYVDGASRSRGYPTLAERRPGHPGGSEFAQSLEAKA
jgi:NAD(P)-dependent dehydrogenase (short-subunit alcohol dehydrogenase family)